jgi:homoserine kinase type II
MRCQASVQEDDVAQVGAALARVHLASIAERFELGPGRFKTSDLTARLDRIEREAAPELAAVAPELRRKLVEHDRAASAHALVLPRGLVHGDLFRDNVLFDAAGRLVALLDFESAFEGVLLFDVMVTMLSWCFGDDLDARLVRALVAGYEAVRPLEAVEREADALYTQACLVALRFTVTRITDYAMRGGEGRVLKDWRRFAQRLARLEELGPQRLAATLAR